MTLTAECREKIQRWVDALRSGEYTQCRGSYCKWVKDATEPGGGRWELCALGVYEDVNGVGEWNTTNPDPNLAAERDGYVNYLFRPDDGWVGGDPCVGAMGGPGAVINRNDHSRQDFATIAAWAEETFLHA